MCSRIPAWLDVRTGGGFGRAPAPGSKTTTASPTAPSPGPGILPPAQWAGTRALVLDKSFSPLHLFPLGLGSNLPRPPLPLPSVQLANCSLGGRDLSKTLGMVYANSALLVSFPG